MCAVPTLGIGTFSAEQDSVTARGAGACTQYGSGCRLGGPSTSQILVHFLSAVSARNDCYHPIQMSQLCPLQLCNLLSCGGLCPGVELHHRASKAGRGVWLRLGMSCGGHRTPSRIKGSSIFSSALFQEKSEPVCVLPQHSLCSSSPAVSPTGFHIS